MNPVSNHQPTLFRNDFREPLLSLHKPPRLQIDSTIKMVLAVAENVHKHQPQEDVYNVNILNSIYNSSFLSSILFMKLSKELGIKPEIPNSLEPLKKKDIEWFDKLIEKFKEDDPKNTSNTIGDLYWNLAKLVEFHLHPHDALIFRLAAALENHPEGIKFLKDNIPEWLRKQLRDAYRELHKSKEIVNL